jgi:hypothetical protein
MVAGLKDIATAEEFEALIAGDKLVRVWFSKQRFVGGVARACAHGLEG